MIFAMIGLAFIFAFYAAWMFMLKDNSSIKKKWNADCDKMKWEKDD